jgi:hypothetical protein
MGEQQIKKEMNEYLRAEFGIDEGSSQEATEDWPFELTALGRISPGPGDPDVFLFQADEPYFAVAAGALNFLPVQGMSLDDLRLQFTGSHWIYERNPVDLATSILGRDDVPRVPQRREAIVTLARQVLGNDADLRILEGLYLRSTAEYLALIESIATGEAWLVGSGIGPMPVPYAQCSAWRRLAYGMGAYLARKGRSS